ncbi:MAG: hypothetical protein JKY56_09330 [Kofleriaceae bacterium]|nr:hypothetical protein [Kofleriaceae bacterium]
MHISYPGAITASQAILVLVSAWARFHWRINFVTKLNLSQWRRPILCATNSAAFTPRAAFEIHYSSTTSEFRENRFILGVNWKFSKRMRFDAFSQFQSEYNKCNDGSNHVFGVGMTYYFKRLKKKKDKTKAPAAATVL